jgi:hypothetical protein
MTNGMVTMSRAHTVCNFACRTSYTFHILTNNDIDNPNSRYYISPSPPNRMSPAPPYDLQQRYSTPPLFPPHPALGSLHMNLPQHPYYQDPNHNNFTIPSNGYAVPMLPPDAWPATSLATVPEATNDDEETRSISTRSSGTVMVAVGTGSPKPSMVARDYTSSVLLSRSPPVDDGPWSGPSRFSGPPRRRSMVGEVYDDSRS